MVKAEGVPAGLAILGPTGCGKSALAIRVAAALPVEIISVDSAQVYRGMDIGTAKPTLAEQCAVPHHLIDIRDPEQAYSAGEFRSDALRLAGQISARGRMPLLVGGTMLYYRALFRGIAELPTADAHQRAQIDARAAREGWPALHAGLAVRDPASARRIHPNDAQRIQRALEVLAVSGRPLDEQWREQITEDFSGWRICVLEPADRQRLHELLGQRFAAMLEAGLVEEVHRLLARGTLSDKSHTLRLVGYRQLLGYVRGEEDLSTAAAKAIAATRQLAKRQLTWLRSENLLPYGAKVMRGDPFDETTQEIFMRHLIEAGTPAC